VYDEAKRFAEALTMAYHREHDVNTRLVRIFNTYGPRMRLEDGRAIPAFITQALRREPVTVFGDGSQTRSFCYVDDLVEGIVRLMRADYAEPVNLGNPEEYTIRQLAERIIAETQSTSRLVFKPLPQDDPKQRCPDISVAKRVLGWQPAMPLAEGLRKTIEWFAEELKLTPTGGGRHG
jgi:dTDP-glucose 4,6-dehydratase